LYDGLCGFCDVSVQWLLQHDATGVFHFAALEGDAARAIVARHPEIPKGLDSILLVDQSDGVERLAWHSTAIWRICARLPYPWRALSWLAVLPRPLTDLGYRAFAAIRYRVWGRRDACRIPTPAQRARFLA
jgi:predicted DCC family thiol-disulfide oxidoreductase YuxK